MIFEKKKLWWLLNVLLFGIITAICYGSVHSNKPYFLAALLLPMVLTFTVKAPHVFPFGLYVFVLPMDFILIISGNYQGATYTMLLGGLSIVALVVNGIHKRRLLPFNNVVKWHWLFIMWALASTLWAMDSSVSVGRMFTLMALISLYTVTSLYSFKRNEYEFIKKAVMYGGVAAAIFTIYSYEFLGEVRHGLEKNDWSRATLMYGNMSTDPNFFMFYLLLPFALCFYRLITSRKLPEKVYFSLIVLVMVYTATIAGSKGGLLGMATMAIVMAYYSSQKFKILTVAVIFSAFALLVAPEMLFLRMQDTISSGGSGRLGIWTVGLDAFSHNLFGVGLDNFRIAYGHYVNDIADAGVGLSNQMYPHNIFLETLVEFGPIGLIIFLALILGNFRLLRSPARKLGEAELLKAAFLGMLVQGVTLGVLFTKQFWLIFSLISIYHNVEKEKEFNVTGEKGGLYIAPRESNV